MKSIAAGKFKNSCLKTLDDVAATKTSVVITKRGRVGEWSTVALAG